MAMDAGEIERLIKAGIPDAQVTIRDLAGDGDHYAATVISASFKGKSRVQQHQLVYEALKGQMGGVLHALALQTGTPALKILIPERRHRADRHLEPGRARRRFRIRGRHARHRSGEQTRCSRARKQRIRQAFKNMKTIAESEGASLVRLRAPDRLCHRHGAFAPAGEQGAGGTLGRRALSAAHHRRGGKAQSGRHFRGGRHVLRAAKGLIGNDFQPLWGGDGICATYIDNRANSPRAARQDLNPWPSSNSSTTK